MQLYQTGHEKGYDWLLGTAPAASDAVSCYINQATLTRLFTLNEMIAPIDLSNSGTFHVLTARWWWYKNKWPEEKRAVRCSVAAKLVIRRAENSLCTNKYTVAGGSPRAPVMTSQRLTTVGFSHSRISQELGLGSTNIYVFDLFLFCTAVLFIFYLAGIQ